MPMYFPDLASVKKLAEMMQTNSKPYTWIIPENEEELKQARKELGQYFRTEWNDKIQAMEVEMWVSEENYTEKLQQWVMKEMINSMMNQPKSY